MSDNTMLTSMHLKEDDDDNDIAISTHNLPLIINLCNEIAKKIKDEVLHTIEHYTDKTS